MSLWEHLLRSLVCPGLLSALLWGGLARGTASWLAAVLRRRPAAPPWQPLAELGRLAGKSRPAAASPQARATWPLLLGLAALAMALGMLPWPRWLLDEDAAAGLLTYSLLLLAPALARLAAAGLSEHAPAGLGTYRQVAAEIARFFPLLLSGAAVALISGQVSLSPDGPLTLPRALVGAATAAMLLATLPWPLWDRDAYDAPLSGLGGRALALARALELLELAAQTGLVAVALRAGGFLPNPEIWPLPIAAGAVLLALTGFEIWGRRPFLPEAARLYTRWLLPAAALLAFAGWWFGP